LTQVRNVAGNERRRERKSWRGHELNETALIPPAGHFQNQYNNSLSSELSVISMSIISWALATELYRAENGKIALPFNL